MADSAYVVVFPIFSSAFGVRADWFEAFTPQLIHPSYLLATMLLILWVGIMVLKRFEEADFARKFWNVPVILGMILFWPSLVVGLKELVDTFNTFLIVRVFGIPWHGFGFPSTETLGSLAAWPAEGLARLLPNLAYWIIYAFYLIYFFFYAVLGPLVLAKGILSDEIETFFGLVRELVNLLLWQTTLLILVVFILPDIVSGKPFPPHPQSNFYFLSLVLGVMIFFTPTLTRKFVLQLEGAVAPLGFRWAGSMLGLTLAGRIGTMGLSTMGFSTRAIEEIKPWKDRALRLEEFKSRYDHRREIQDLRDERDDMEKKLHEDFEQEYQARKKAADAAVERKSENFFALSKQAKSEIGES